MKKILLVAALMTATALSAQAATQTTTTTHYHSESYYNWNPFSQGTTGLYVQAQGGEALPSNTYGNTGVYNLSVGWQFHPMVRAEVEAGYRGTGNMNTYTALVNGYFDFKNDTRFTPFLGAGLGYADVNKSNQDNAFAYQGIAGVSYAIDNNWALTAQYNYLDTTSNYSASEIKGGIRYTF
jgi:opacity protein-like surface antigen